MNLKVGDYCRTLKGVVQIAKIEDGVMTDTKGYLHYGDFIKSSPNIIDLIEVGDYVNNEKIVDIDEDEIFTIFDNVYTNEDIKSIVTKEQFEQMEYRIGEDE